MPRYVTIDLFGKVEAGKTTLFNHFAGNSFLQEGGNLSYDMRTYYARCWVLPNRWSHSMVFLADPKFEMRWKDLNVKYLQKMFEPTNILMIVTDSTEEDVMAVKNSFSFYPRVKRSLIKFIIANKQDLPDRMSVSDIQKTLEMKDVLGLSAIAEETKAKVEPFLEEAVKRYFIMLSKKGQEMELVDETEYAKPLEKIKEEKKPGKYHGKLLGPKGSEGQK
jgi:signal recognition particle receptor subunit beta